MTPSDEYKKVSIVQVLDLGKDNTLNGQKQEKNKKLLKNPHSEEQGKTKP